MIFTNDDYFNWLLEKVGVLHGEYENYSLLVQYLYSREYEYLIAMDSNRASGGLWSPRPRWWTSRCPA